MTSQLIVNADDFGIGKHVSDGIIDAFTNGIVRSTSMMANMPAAEYAAELALAHPDLGVGVHLTLTHGRPLSDPGSVRDLIDSKGFFLPSHQLNSRLWFGDSLSRQIELEFSSQIRRALELGITPTHCDSHHGIHKRPVARSAMIRAMKQFGIRCVRNQHGPFLSIRTASLRHKVLCLTRNTRRMPAYIYDSWTRHLMKNAGIEMPTSKVSPSRMIPSLANEKEQLIQCLSNLPQGVSELIFHPGHPDSAVEEESSHQNARERDRILVTDPDVIRCVEDANVNLISYRDLRALRGA